MKQYYCILLLLFSFSFYAQNDTIPVVKKTNISVVSADKMNVVYRGMPNPISIAVPNTKSFTATGDGLTFENGKYILRPTGKEVVINVVYKSKKGVSINEKHLFRIIPLPNISYTINNESGCGHCGAMEFTKKELKDAIIGFTFHDLVYDVFDIKAERFNIHIDGHETMTIMGNKLTDEVFKVIENSKEGTVIIISGVRVDKRPDDRYFDRMSVLEIKLVD
jgi:hypothetical protein